MLSEQEQRKSNFSTGAQMCVAAHEVMVRLNIKPQIPGPAALADPTAAGL